MTWRVRPGRPLAPIAVAVAVLGTWWLVAHNSGAGWVQTLGDFVFGTVFIGILGPAVVLARAKVEVRAAPGDATAGMPVVLQLSSSSRIRVQPLHPTGPDVFAGPVRRGWPADDELTLIPTWRGVYDSIVVEIATAAPFGLQWWTRRERLALPVALHVSPRRGRPVDLPPDTDDRAGEDARRIKAPSGENRGARPYETGDVRRHVHWPATSHAGELMVREMEGPASEPVTVTVDLPEGQDTSERVAERALGTVLRLLDRGDAVRLITTEQAGRVDAPVADRRSAGRRLARAVTGSGRDDPIRVAPCR